MKWKFKAQHLQGLPTLRSSNKGRLVIETPIQRVWINRNAEVTVEVLVEDYQPSPLNEYLSRGIKGKWNKPHWVIRKQYYGR